MAKQCLECSYCELRKKYFYSTENPFNEYLQPHCIKKGYDVSGFDKFNEPICIDFKKRSEVLNEKICRKTD